MGILAHINAFTAVDIFLINLFVFVLFFSTLIRYEDLRYWYDCLCYDEELRKYDEYIAALHEQENQYASAAQEVSFEL